MNARRAEMAASGGERQHEPCFIAVHVGAGYHAQDKARCYKKAMRTALQRALQALQLGGSPTEAAAVAVACLEVRSLARAAYSCALHLGPW